MGLLDLLNNSLSLWAAGDRQMNLRKALPTRRSGGSLTDRSSESGYRRLCPLFILVALTLSAPRVRASGVDYQQQVAQLFGQRGLSGALLSQSVANGSTIASVNIGDGPNGMPLSAAKLFVVAIFEDRRQQLPKEAWPDIDLVVARGNDDSGRQLALSLRRSLGSARVLHYLARFGFPSCTEIRSTNCTTLSSATPDADWADTLSLGEARFRVTPSGLSEFVRIIGNAGLGPDHHRVITRQAARRVERAMIATVEFGTARGSHDRLGELGAIGGKTGTTASGGGAPYDGLFCGLIFDRAGVPRYTVVTYVRRGGSGGGAAAQISTELASLLLAADQ